jgi:hypothetical protein
VPTTNRFYLLHLVILSGVGLIAFYGIAARFAISEPGANYVADSALNNNDMMRELAFVQLNMAHYTPSDSLKEAANFLRTPFDFILPSFLGFNKPIPYHLLAYNFERAGIALESGQGNVFPGLVADHYMVFGIGGAVVFALVMVLALFLIQGLGAFIVADTTRGGFYAVNLVSVFVSFRNLQGSLILTMILSLAGIWLAEKIRRAKSPHSSPTALLAEMSSENTLSGLNRRESMDHGGRR